MSGFASGLYAGVVTHARHRPRRHRLRYRIFMLLIDLDEQPRLAGALRLLAFGGFGLASFSEADHGDGSGRPLKAQIEAHLTGAGLPTGGPVRVLVMPRILGRGFNPLTVYFCHDRTGELSAIFYEVNNTFGERHAYLLPAGEGRPVDQSCEKAFYVSPFMDMDLAYAFRVAPPGEAVSVAVEARDGAGAVLSAAFAGRRRELSDRALIRAWATHPWMSLGVLAAIHWEALKIWLKGEKIRVRPPAPVRFVTAG